MSKKYIACDGDRIDQIVYEHYGTLDVLSQVFDANPGIAQYLTLPMGLEITLPDIAVPTTDTGKLWSGA